MPLSVVILAAGQGKRMKSGWAEGAAAARRACASQACDRHGALSFRRMRSMWSTGHGAEQVQAAFSPKPYPGYCKSVSWERATPPASSAGHSRMRTRCWCCMATCRSSVETHLKCCFKLADSKTLAVLRSCCPIRAATAVSCGDARGRIRKIVEHKDASPKELRIRETKYRHYCRSGEASEEMARNREERQRAGRVFTSPMWLRSPPRENSVSCRSSRT